MLDKTTARKVAEQYAERVRNVLNPSSIVLFGSCINGTPNEWSDIDVAVIMHDFSGNWLETSSALWELTLDVSIDIEPHFLDETHDPSGFVEHVKKTGEYIYKIA
jgi:predicted nucleotidyltransferase